MDGQHKHGSSGGLLLVAGLAALVILSPAITTAVGGILEIAKMIVLGVIMIIGGIGGAVAVLIYKGKFRGMYPPYRPPPIVRKERLTLPPRNTGQPAIEGIRKCHWCEYTNQPLEVLFHEIHDHRG